MNLPLSVRSLSPRRALIVLAASAILGAAPDDRPAPLDVRAEVELVTVDAVVLDQTGDPLGGLTSDDFVVREDGAEQTISSFEAITLPPIAAPAVPRSAAQEATLPPATLATNGSLTPRPGRTVLIVFDEVHLTPVTEGRAREVVTRFVRDGLSDGDRVVVLPTGGRAAWSATLPEGRAQLLAFLESLEAKHPARLAMEMTDYEAYRISVHHDERLLSEVYTRLCMYGRVGDAERCKRYQTQLNLQGTPFDTHRETMDLGRTTAAAPALVAEAEALHQANTARALATLGVLENALAAAAHERGRKLAFLVSEGFLHDTRLPEWRATLAAAQRANASLHFVDPRADAPRDDQTSAETMTPVHEVIANEHLDRLPLDTIGADGLAAGTGGSTIKNATAAAELMTALALQSRMYYLLGYEPRHAVRDGKYHSLAIEVHRPQVKVVARKGYYASEPGAKGQPKRAGRTLDPRVAALLDAPSERTGLPLRLATYVLGPSKDGRSSLLLATETDLATLDLRESGGRQRGQLDWTLLIVPRGRSEAKAMEWRTDLALEPATAARLAGQGIPALRELELSPGTYQLRLVAREARTGQVGSLRQTVQVPEQDELHLSTPILSDATRRVGETAQPIPVAHRTFAAGTKVLCLYGVYGARRDPATGQPRVQAGLTLRRANGEPIVHQEPMPLEPEADGRLAQTIPLVLAGAAPGEYELLIRVEDQVAGHTLERREPFTVR